MVVFAYCNKLDAVVFDSSYNIISELKREYPFNDDLVGTVIFENVFYMYFKEKDALAFTLLQYDHESNKFRIVRNIIPFAKS